ncbi:hypothetical protein W822_09615 [Advenella kashmirensis W13003]|uniref:Uncharacterized protein n=1 Tax=Advenella kashmirensis W13003 TaxID=1424334 RepID=V8QU82_9BURK|nr:hypothetical protein W822_09615 [Advenella kashmirensis W13003]
MQKCESACRSLQTGSFAQTIDLNRLFCVMQRNNCKTQAV